MGFFTTLFRGTKGFAAATNALLAEVTLPTLGANQRSRLRVQILHVLRSGGMTSRADEQLLEFFNNQPRLVQLNLVAIACADLNIPPIVFGEIWHEVRNPFLPQIYDEADLMAVSHRILNQRRVKITIRTEPIELSEL